MPLHLDGEDASSSEVEAVGRLEPDATLDVVQARALALVQSLRSAGENVPPGQGLVAQPFRYRMIAREVRVMASAMVLLVSFVLLIACADVANLLVARALARSHDTAVRLALGGGRWRIVRQHALEALVIAGLGGALGFVLAAAAVDAFERSTRSFLAYWMVFRLDLPVLGFCAFLVLVAAAITGLLPALQSRRVDVHTALQTGGREARGTGSEGSGAGSSRARFRSLRRCS
jgi:ABC-type lipoprotein release transport system permease subunit